MNEKKRTLYYILIVLLIVLVGSYFLYQEKVNLIQVLAEWAYSNDDNKNGKAIELILKVIGGIVILIGLRFAMIRAKSSLKAVENQSISINNQTKQIELTQQSQINENFKNAIEHLGSDKESVVLGGISELHFIARDNPSNFKEVVLNILCSKVRSEANVAKKPNEINFTVIQTIINYIFKTDVYEHLPKNLEFSNLHSIDFSDMEIVKTNLKFCRLPWRFTNTNFIDCDLSSSKANVGRYEKISFQNCNLFQIFFRSTKFDGLKIISDDETTIGLRFLDCDFIETFFFTEIFSSSFFSCHFISTKFKGESISSTQFSGSKFENIHLQGVSLSDCNFSVCSFKDFSTTSWVMNCQFKGVNNEKYHVAFKLKELLNDSLGKKPILENFHSLESYFVKNKVEELSKTDIDSINSEYEKLIEDYEKAIGKKSDKKNKNTPGD